jgi:hypothetical protein
MSGRVAISEFCIQQRCKREEHFKMLYLCYAREQKIYLNRNGTTKKNECRGAALGISIVWMKCKKAAKEKMGRKSEWERYGIVSHGILV